MNSTQFLLALPLLSVTAGTVIAQSDWDEPFPPHRIADNLYYVGSKGLANYLVTTTNGHILINSSFERTLPIIRGGVEMSLSLETEARRGDSFHALRGPGVSLPHFSGNRSQASHCLRANAEDRKQ